MSDIDLNTKMVDILRMHPEAGAVLAEYGLHCAECSGARHESLRQGAINHGLDPEELLARIVALTP
jgi:hybrid cluster-associated redox disulfide protein